jgi:AcrR family transcriptional regulator
MPTKRARQRRRPPLTRDRILHAALRIVDKAGVEALSMRRLAKRLGVEAMSLYKHVANRDEVLDGLLDLVITEIEMPPVGTPWRFGMRTRAMSARRVFLRHRWAAALFEARVMIPSPVRLRYSNAVLGLLFNDGFTASTANRAFLLIDSYLYGFIMQEVNQNIEPSEIPQIAERMTAPPSMAEYPYLVQAISHFMASNTPPEQRMDAEFEYGLELILDSLARLRDAAPGAPV